MNWKLLIILLIIFDILIWGWILVDALADAQNLSMYFLDVGQGDSELIKIGDVDILVDGGPDAKVLESLSKILPISDRYLDLVILTHPHLDHFGGLIDILKNYQVGYVLDSGFGHDTQSNIYFQKEISDKKIKHLVLREGDKIKYKDLEFDIISPAINAKPVKTKDLHDNTIVFIFKKENFKGIFTGDINFKVENRLLNKYKEQLTANLLKVSHHGSDKSTSNNWLKVVKPQISIIGVGGKNRYGHPKENLLARLQNSGAKIFRTDEDGTIKISLIDGKLKVARTR